jgi:hypothetical protein
MNMENLLLQPFTAFLIFLALGYIIYHTAGDNTIYSGPPDQGHQTYTGGERIPRPSGKVHYQAFFWMALLFSILHMAALVISTLPFASIPKSLALIYLIGTGASIFVLTEEEF